LVLPLLLLLLWRHSFTIPASALAAAGIITAVAARC
jgi:hypothetical protein